MVTTRSANKQPHSEGLGISARSDKKKANEASQRKEQSKPSVSKDGGMLSPPPSPTRKRKTSLSNARKDLKKKSKIDNPKDDSIIINRAPVLHLWAATVTHFLYPKLDWSTCLSAGNAISAICAVAKGRSIGKIDEPDDSEARSKKKEAQKEKEQDYEVLEVMHFRLKQKDGKVYFSGKPQSDHEETLRMKYGDRYDEVKDTFENALEQWKGEGQELSKAAFGMYEDFRPNIAAGQKGWGRKGALDLSVVRKTIEKD